MPAKAGIHRKSGARLSPGRCAPSASTHIHVNRKKLCDRYLSEFTFRLNRGEMKNAMFDLLISAV
jgi:hypothetical protein